MFRGLECVDKKELEKKELELRERELKDKERELKLKEKELDKLEYEINDKKEETKIVPGENLSKSKNNNDNKYAVLCCLALIVIVFGGGYIFQDNNTHTNDVVNNTTSAVINNTTNPIINATINDKFTYMSPRSGEMIAYAYAFSIVVNNTRYYINVEDEEIFANHSYLFNIAENYAIQDYFDHGTELEIRNIFGGRVGSITQKNQGVIFDFPIDRNFSFSYFYSDNDVYEIDEVYW